VGPAEPVVCAPAPDPVPEGLLPLAAAEPDGLEALPDCDATDADDAEADFEADADEPVTLATEEEPDTLTTAEPPLMEPAVPDMSP
jgi:hypothetical protein